MELPRAMISDGPYKNILDCNLFVSASCSESLVRLLLLSRDDLSSCVQRFHESVHKGCKTKAAYVKLIENKAVHTAVTVLQS